MCVLDTRELSGSTADPGSPTAGGPAVLQQPPWALLGSGFLRAASRSHDSLVPAGDQALCCVLENVSRTFFQAAFTEHCRCSGCICEQNKDPALEELIF